MNDELENESDLEVTEDPQPNPDAVEDFETEESPVSSDDPGSFDSEEDSPQTESD